MVEVKSSSSLKAASVGAVNFTQPRHNGPLELLKKKEAEMAKCYLSGPLLQTSQGMRMLSIGILNCGVIKIVMNSKYSLS